MSAYHEGGGNDKFYDDEDGEEHELVFLPKNEDESCYYRNSEKSIVNTTFAANFGMVHDLGGKIEGGHFDNRNDDYEEILEILVGAGTTEDTLQDTRQQDHDSVIDEAH